MTLLDMKNAMLVGLSTGGGKLARYGATDDTERVAKAVFAGAVAPCLYKSANNPDGGLDDATIALFKTGVATDRMAFLDAFTHGCFRVGGKLSVSEAQRVYARDVAALASPKKARLHPRSS